MSDTPRTDAIAAKDKRCSLETLEEIAKLERDLSAAREDAERYRWLRERKTHDVFWTKWVSAVTHEQIDAAIDAARKDSQ